MNGHLLDTNILSELRKAARCNPGVRTWIESADPDGLFVSVLVLGEIRQGIERIKQRDARQATTLERWLQRLSTQFEDRILGVDKRVADQWGRMGLRQPVPTLNALIAATAMVHDLIVVSRDESGYRNTGARLLNPFSML
ncbi:MAG: type II toxin-antitoxin system VapC family toxin [Verrucomicrobiae bacterium]|nr:type II toxin-antitoxin system VapC family toxin [Verrucomicrobiae bacterium]